MKRRDLIKGAGAGLLAGTFTSARAALAGGCDLAKLDPLR